jgi:hypothetical protein
MIKAFFPEEALEYRDQEGGRLSGSRLRLDGRIPALQCLRERLFLNGCQFRIAPFLDVPEEVGGQVQFIEMHSFSFI